MPWRAWRKKARSPGGPTVPTVMRSTASKSNELLTLHPLPSFWLAERPQKGRVLPARTGWGPGGGSRGGQLGEVAEGVDGEDGGPLAAVGDGGHRARRDDD